MLDKTALFLIILGGIHLGVTGLFQFDLAAYLLGGSDTLLCRILYALIGIAALWCIPMLFREDSSSENSKH